MIKSSHINFLQKKGGEKMEEKKVTKISLSTFFLILAIIAIIVMGIFIYKLSNDKTTESKKSAELQIISLMTIKLLQVHSQQKIL